MHLYTLSCNCLPLNLCITVPISPPLLIFCVVAVRILLTFILFVSASPQTAVTHIQKLQRKHNSQGTEGRDL